MFNVQIVNVQNVQQLTFQLAQIVFNAFPIVLLAQHKLIVLNAPLDIILMILNALHVMNIVKHVQAFNALNVKLDIMPVDLIA